jgi:hypothetical protein
LRQKKLFQKQQNDPEITLQPLLIQAGNQPNLTPTPPSLTNNIETLKETIETPKKTRKRVRFYEDLIPDEGEFYHQKRAKLDSNGQEANEGGSTSLFQQIFRGVTISILASGFVMLIKCLADPNPSIISHASSLSNSLDVYKQGGEKYTSHGNIGGSIYRS